MDENKEKPLVDDELLDDSGAAPEQHQVVEDRPHDRIPDPGDTPAVSVEELQEILQQKEDKYLRLYAEFENFKRRNRQERLTMMETAGAKTMQALLPVLDDFDRAARAAQEDDASAQVWNSGVGLIVKKLQQSLAAQGLKPMESNGQAFDADLYEAVTEIPHPELAGRVVDTVERGYTLNGKIIRHAKVVVGK